jgi:hypothetical protein
MAAAFVADQAAVVATFGIAEAAVPVVIEASNGSWNPWSVWTFRST